MQQKKISTGIPSENLLIKIGVFVKNNKKINQEYLYKKAKAVIRAIQFGKVTAYRVGIETGVNVMSIQNVSERRAKLQNLSFTTALGLLQYYEDHPELFSEE